MDYFCDLLVDSKSIFFPELQCDFQMFPNNFAKYLQIILVIC